MKTEAPQQMETNKEKPARNTGMALSGVETAVTTQWRTKAELVQERKWMEAVCERGNLKLAYQRVMENKGAAGVDGIGVAAFKDHLKQHWPTIKAKILAGTYIPQSVRRVDIPKPQGGTRTLGILTLTDRFIQQALHQVLSPIFEAEFSESSYGFRRGRNAHQAVKDARRYVAEGRRFVVDMDLEKFFDRVNHDILMEKLSKKIEDSRVLRLIRRYLEELDGWIRHKLRCILWRQWKRLYTRTKNLMKAGLKEESAFRSAFNQRGPWWNSGASHMNQAFPKSFFDRLGLVSLQDTMRRLQSVQ